MKRLAPSATPGNSPHRPAKCRPASLGTLWVFGALLALNADSLAVAQVLSKKDSKPSTVSAEDREFFERKIRPVLAERCWSCHGPEVQEGDLRLDSPLAALEGGSRGAAWSPGAPDKSLLISAVNHADTLQMPPKEKLPASVIADLTEWVRRGAPWPDAPPPPTARPAKPNTLEPAITPEQQTFWAFQPLQRFPLPAVDFGSWCESPIDAFVLARLRDAQITPAARADRRALLRRATFDLTGLPPSSADAEAFLADNSPDALARLTDRLLASPRHGERWGRHWLDIARYGDSNGLDENLSFANAHRYRDYVVRAFNRDKPYDEFLREQLAGDLLLAADHIDTPPSSASATLSEQQVDRLTATGFLVIGAKMLAEDDPVKMQMDIVDEQVDTLGKAVLGLTLGCARCHDHKYDPISMADYYGLAGIFKSTKTMENFSVVARWQERPLASSAELDRLRHLQSEITQRQATITAEAARHSQDVTRTVREQSARYLLAAARQLQRDERLQAAKSFGQARQSDPAAKLPPGTQVIEAENYARGNALKLTSGYGEGIGVILNAGPLPNVAEYDIQVPAAGTYQLELRYAAAEARPVSLAINGRVVKPNAAKGSTGSWNPDTQTWVVEGFFEFRADANIVRLERDQPFPHIDKLAIAPVDDPAALALESAAPPATATGELFDAYVRQWAETLKASRGQSASPFAEWHAYARHFAGDNAAPLPPPRYVTGEPPASWLALAERYQQAILQAHDAWQKLKATPEGREAKALPDARLEALRALVDAPQGPLATPKNIEEYFPAAARESLRIARDEVQRRQAEMPKFDEVMAVSEGTVGDLKIHLRGNHTSLGALVARRVPRVLAGTSPPTFSADKSGRLELANWLTDPRHPLTSRVLVNRVWHWHFGAGLVRSNDNFGLLGERPTHPELLDWLSLQFTDSGWSIKQLHRELMLSATYQQSSHQRDDVFQRDPENRLWWRYPKRRLEAEAIRDAILAVGGQIDLRMGGSQLTTPNRQYVTSTASVNPVIYENTRRSIYLPVVRSALYEVFQAFDFAEPSVMNGQRDSTTVPPQALFMLNSALVARQSEALARDLLESSGFDPSPAGDAQRLEQAYLRTFARHPTAVERHKITSFLADYAQASGEGADATAARRRAWQGLCRALLASNEFVYLD